MNIPIPQGVRNRAKDTYFRLTPTVRDKLLESKLTAAEWRIWCYLISLDPFGDRGAKFSPAELMLKCAVKKSTYFAAKAKFQKLSLFDFQDGVTKVVNLQGFSNQSKISECSQQEQLIESKISESDSKILEFKSEISESNSRISECQKLKPLLDKDSTTLQTLQTVQTFQTKEEEGEKIFEKGSKQAKEKVTNSKLPENLINKLEELEIPLDGTVRKAIASHHISQVYGAAAHVEKTWDTVKNPKSVFLYQLPKQPIEKLPQSLSSEFLDWYAQASSDEIVEDLPPEYLSRDRNNEPLVRLKQLDPITGAPYRLVEWRRVQAEPDYNPDKDLVSLADLSSFLKQFIEKGNKKQ
ncbi:hypothetical protein NIES593_22715 [Hydrococcus rivularis NIES-593]|uniref:Uncharacterized protein n=2 Tax=Cyanophyceae TaxID=3028117 RepID=A0A1U7H774_9CYAN|nr:MULTISPECIES: hypothetical protein [Cyanophyceae]OKH10815.1 hypothetical protein NIES592_23850 [Fischerella major NIES-592]OKH17835.1 hypothetical protein NIES593_22715 [Hydrococcus rivularis NIES-593]